MKRKSENQNKSLYRIAGLGTTLAGFIGLGVYGGLQLDKFLEWELAAGTATGSIVGLGIGLWYVLRGLKKK